MRSFRLILALLLLPSVLLSHTASLDDPVWFVVPGVLSVLLLIYVFTEIYARVPTGLLRFCVGLALLTPVACYLFAQLLSYELQGSYFNQRFFYHFTINTLLTTWQAFSREIFIFLMWMLAQYLTLWRYSRIDFHCQRLSGNAVTLLLLVALVSDPGLTGSTRKAIAFSLATEDFVLENTNWERLRLNPGALGVEELNPGSGRNLLLIYLEGLENIYADSSVFPGLTPNLNALSEQGQRIHTMDQALGTGWTIAGITASLCGTPLLYYSDVNGNEIEFENFLTEVTCTTDLLNAAGYQQVFMGGADTAFANKGTFLRQHGYDQALGRDELGSLLDDPDNMGGWGLYDADLFDLAVDEYSRLAASGSPFNLTLLTVDTHHPSGEPSPGCAPYGKIDNSILHAVHCTDQLIGKFLDEISQHPAYEDTLVILMSDHLAMRNAAFELFPDDYERRLFFLALNSDVPILPQIRVTHMDLAATLPALMRVEHNIDFLAGVDLTREKKPPALSNTRALQWEHAIATINSYVFTP